MDLTGINLQNEKNLVPDKGSVIIAYHKYQGYVLPLVVIVASILLLFMLVIPQINQFFASKQEYDLQNQKLQVLKNNHNFLTNLSEDKTKSDLLMLTSILPSEKDFLGIITAVSDASSRSGLSIDSYRFSLGNLSKADSGSEIQFPAIQMELNTIGDAASLNNFIYNLNSSAPLVEIISIRHKDTNAYLRLQFFYKPFPPQSISDDTPVIRITSGNQLLLNNLYSWNNLPSLNPDTGYFSNDLSSASANLNPEATASSGTSSSPFQ